MHRAKKKENIKVNSGAFRENVCEQKYSKHMCFLGKGKVYLTLNKFNPALYQKFVIFSTDKNLTQFSRQRMIKRVWLVDKKHLSLHSRDSFLRVSLNYIVGKWIYKNVGFI